MQKVWLFLTLIMTLTHASSSNDFVMDMIQSDLERTLNLYKIGDSKNAKEALKFALYHGYRNTGFKSQIEKERSFEEANAMEEKFLRLEALIEDPHQSHLVILEMNALQEAIRAVLPKLSPLMKQATIKNWHSVAQEIKEALLEAIVLYEHNAIKQAVSKVQSVYFDIFENSGMEEAILALSEDRKLKAEQRFRIFSEMMKKKEAVTTLLNYTEEMDRDLKELASAMTPQELSSMREMESINQKHIFPSQWLLISALFLLIPMGGWWFLLKKQRNRE